MWEVLSLAMSNVRDNAILALWRGLMRLISLSYHLFGLLQSLYNERVEVRSWPALNPLDVQAHAQQ
jgi:hypothetical protein